MPSWAALSPARAGMAAASWRVAEIRHRHWSRKVTAAASSRPAAGAAGGRLGGGGGGGGGDTAGGGGGGGPSQDHGGDRQCRPAGRAVPGEGGGQVAE